MSSIEKNTRTKKLALLMRRLGSNWAKSGEVREGKQLTRRTIKLNGQLLRAIKNKQS